MEKTIKKKNTVLKKSNTKSFKELTYKKYFGKIKEFGDGVSFQRKLRDE